MSKCFIRLVQQIFAPLGAEKRTCENKHMSYSPKPLKGGYIGDCIGTFIGDIKGILGD